MNQRNATVSTLIAVLQERGVEYVLNGETPIKDVLNDTDKKTVRDTIFAMFRGGQIEMTADAKIKYSVDAEMKKYVSGLVNNWINKAPEFNGGEKYQAKNPGSRKGQGDAMVREMKKLLAAAQDEDTKKLVQSHIDARLLEIKPIETGVDFDHIPESLKAKLGIK